MVNNWPSRQDIWNWWALEWFKVAAYPALLDIVCRASNRMLVGLPLCESFLSRREIKIYIYIGRDPDYLELNKRFAADLIKTSYVLSMVPFFLRPYILVIGTVCRCWSFFFQGCCAFDEWRFEHQAWDETHRSICERTCRAGSAIQKRLAGQTGLCLVFPCSMMVYILSEWHSNLAVWDFERKETYFRRYNHAHTLHQPRIHPPNDNST